MIVATVQSALAALVIRWRAALAVAVLVATPLVLPFVVIQTITAFSLTGSGDPILLQHALWLLGSPEVPALFFAVWMILLGPWAVGIWGASDSTQTRIGIGWQAYGRYLVLGGIFLIVSGLDGLLLAILGLGGEGGLALAIGLNVLSNCAALFVLFRLAAAAVEVRAGHKLALRRAWLQSAAIGGRLLGLSVLWIIAALTLSVLAEGLGLLLHIALSDWSDGPSRLHFALPLAGPGLVKGFMAVFIAVMTLALFWAVAERAASDGDQ